MLDSVNRVNKKYYPHTLFEECKYEIKRNKMGNLLNDDLDPSSSDNETDSESDNDTVINLIMRQTMNNLLKIKTIF